LQDNLSIAYFLFLFRLKIEMTPHSLNDTIAALSTPRGVGAIAVIRMSGKDCFKIAAQIFSAKQDFFSLPLRMTVRGFVHKGHQAETAQNRIDDVLLTKFASPHSYTGEDVVEISCHGSLYVVNEILDALMAHNARLAEPGEFTQRAFLNGKIDLLQAEAIADLIASQTKAGLRLSTSQSSGHLSKRLAGLREEIKNCCMLLEVELDFSDEDVEFVRREDIVRIIEKSEMEMALLIKSFKYGKIFREGAHVVIIGRPNVGKSSLLNALLQEDRAIVSEIPGTTRDSIEESLDIDGFLFRVSDTAGLRESDDQIEKSGVRRTEQLIERADIRLLVMDGSEELSLQDKDILNSMANRSTAEKSKALVAINKCDLSRKILPQDIQALGDFAAVEISAKTGMGMRELERALVESIAFGEEAPMESIIAKVRHKTALEKAKEFLAEAKLSIESNRTADLIAIDLRAALGAIGEITGEVTSEEILHDIFAKFCIGK
jgi:tRNA modification GTPase